MHYWSACLTDARYRNPSNNGNNNNSDSNHDNDNDTNGNDSLNGNTMVTITTMTLMVTTTMATANTITIMVNLQRPRSSWRMAGTSRRPGCSHTGVCENHTPPEKNALGILSLKNTKSVPGLQFLLLCCKAKALVKGVIFHKNTGIKVIMPHTVAQDETAQPNLAQQLSAT